MKVKEVNKILKLVLSLSERNRLKVYQNEQGLNIIADVHGMGHDRACRFICRIINIINGQFHLCIVHGYKNGTVLKDMFRNEFKNRRIEAKFGVEYNKGVTHCLVKPAFGLY